MGEGAPTGMVLDGASPSRLEACARSVGLWRGGHMGLYWQYRYFGPGPNIVYLLVHEQERYSGTMDVTEILKNKKSID